MSLAYDEYGRPYIIVREQELKSRVKGVDAIKANLNAALGVSSTLKTSLGPKGMDKMIVSPDGDVLVTNDGATIVNKMEVVHPVARLMVELSQSQDNEIGDGTTGIVVFAGALIEEALRLLSKGIHPLKIASGFEKAADLCCKHLEEISVKKDPKSKEDLIEAAMTSLGSKVVSKCQKKFAEIAVDAVLKVADLERCEVNFDLIKIVGKNGGALEDSTYIEGILLDKVFSHPQMPEKVEDAKICILTCPFEPPKPKTKYSLNITSASDYKKLAALEQEYFTKMVQKIKDSGATVAFCQWGFDDEANHLLLQNNLPAVRWVSGTDIELLAMATGARIVPRFEELEASKLGNAKLIEQETYGTNNTQFLSIKGLEKAKAVTILLRGGSMTIVEEAKRALHDSLCVVRNLIKDSKVVCGGGATELNCSLYLRSVADEEKGVEQYAIKAFADALEKIPLILAENSGMNSLKALAEAKNLQIEHNTNEFGIACINALVGNMKELGVFESLNSKKQQISLASQVVKMILKIDDVVEQNKMAQFMR